MATNGLDRTERVEKFVRDFLAERGYAPSYLEIGRACGISTTSVVAYHLGKLERKGIIKRSPGVARSIVVIDGC